MPPSSPLRNDQLVSNWLETNWLVSTRTRFWEVSKIALQWPPMSHAFYFAGVDPKSLHKITYGITSELDSTLHNIYAEHGPVDLQIRGRDMEGKYYLKCSQPGNQNAPAKAVICVSPADVDKGRTAVKASPKVLDGNVQDRENWEEVVLDKVVEEEEEEDWVKV